MKIISMNIKNFRYINDATIPMTRELIQVYSDSKESNWDLMVCDSTLFRAIKMKWTSLSNVVTESMNIDSELSALFMDEDDCVRSENGVLVPVIYKAVLKKADDKEYTTDIKIRYYYSNNGSNGPWTETTNKLVLDKIARACDDVIMDFREEEDAHMIRFDPFIMRRIGYIDSYTRCDLPLILPFLVLGNEITYGRNIIFQGVYYFTKTEKIVKFFQDYLRMNKRNRHITIYLEKEEHLDMSQPAVIVHNGVSYEYDSTKYFEKEFEREDFYRSELKRILSIKKEE